MTAAPSDDPERLRGALVDPVQRPDVVGHDDRNEEGEEHRRAAAVGDELRVDAPVVGRGDKGDARRRCRVSGKVKM